MTDWTLAVDESGSAEGSALQGEKADRGGFIIGGLLVPVSQDELAQRLCEKLTVLKRELNGVDLHAAELAPRVRRPILTAIEREIIAADGCFLALRVDVPHGGDELEHLLRYVRALTELVDAAARSVAFASGDRLHLEIAQRSIPLRPTQVGRARSQGLAYEEVRGATGATKHRQLVESEVRQAIDALARERSGSVWHRPKIASINVANAKYTDTLVAADFVTNAVRFAWVADRPLKDVISQPGRWFVVQPNDLTRLREFDRALRASPPDLVEAALQLEAARTHASAQPGLSLENSGAALLGYLWTLIAQKLTTAMTARSAEACLRLLAARAGLMLSARYGEYEGLWLALRDAWASDQPLAVRLRGVVDDVEVQILMERLVVECANHRGDVASVHAAGDRASLIVSNSSSLLALAERFRISTLLVVQAQNQLPALAAESDAVLARLQLVSESLLENARLMVRTLNMLEPASQSQHAPDGIELGLAMLLNRSPFQSAQRNELGAALGTVARSYAFLGRFDEALQLLLEARACFRTRPQDLSFNAVVIGRVLVEMGRCKLLGEQHESLLQRVLSASGISLLSARWASGEAIVQAPSLRFSLDLALRAMLWTRLERNTAEWVDLLAANGGSGLRRSIGENLPGHPSELIARHAMELLRVNRQHEPAAKWQVLARRLAKSAPQTLARIGEMTERLGRAGDGDHARQVLEPRGSVFNPTFEYR